MAAATRFGDAAATIPLAAIVFAALLAGQRATAWRWAAAVGCCGLLTATGKVGLAAWGTREAGLLSPSGHTAASVLVYGGMALLHQGRVAWIAGTLLVGLIAASRLYLHMHTPADVAVGLLIGTASLAWFAPGRPALPADTLRTGGVACGAVCAAAVMGGWSLPIDSWLRLAARHLAAG